MSLIKLTTARFYLLSIRLYSSKHNSSKFIRQQFLDFFVKDNNHHFIKSSSVIPFCDPTLSFCNAGMNQFKNILLGNQEAKYKRVANSQKCIRVGGKHNDLSVVGSDSYHHTFFEMLGNWSFGDYFKKDACEMAWKLLTDVYKIPQERLYVSYFKGDEKLGLAPDLECKDVWRQLGVPDDRIVGFGAKENFWEMGSSGPCGGCSEIHVDHLPSFRNINRSADVNQDKSDLTELWNLVFIEYFRNADGSIEKLPQKHIDTGMGFERLVSFLQSKSSNYDSDLFMPIFDKIHRVTKVPAYTGSFKGSNCEMDTAYRIIADHSRMIAISLSDGMFPEQNGKLRRVLRKCLKMSEKDFNNENLLLVTIPVVAEILGDTFTELKEKLGLVLEIVKHEQEVFKSIRDKMSKDVEAIVRKNPKLAELEMFDYPDFVKGYSHFCDYKKSNKDVLSGDFMYFIYTSCGFDLELIERLAELEGMTIDKDGFDDKMRQDKRAFTDKLMTVELFSQLDCLLNNPTENNLKYNYTFDGIHQTYHIEPVTSKIISIIDQKGSVTSTNAATGPSVKVVVERSPFYYESGGQESDDGYIIKNGKKFKLKSLSSQKNFVLHEIEIVRDEPLQVGDEVQLQVDQEKRSALIRNHSATHLINSAIRKITNQPIYQKSSLVTAENLKIELSCLGPKLSHQDYEKFENLVQTYIKKRPLDRKIKVLNSQELQTEADVVMVPGEVYPDDGIRLVTFGDFSKELCSGTHVFNTRELIDFTFLNMKSTGRNSYLFTATTGSAAINALTLGAQLLEQVNVIHESISSETCDEVESKIKDISSKLNSDLPIAFLKKMECQQLIEEIKLKVKRLRTKMLSDLLMKEMKLVQEENSQNSFIVHFLSCADQMKSDSLQKATQHVTDKPVLIISLTEDKVQARCCVPSHLISDNFNAESWLKQVAQVYRAKISTPKGENPKEVCNMKEKSVNPKRYEAARLEALTASNDYAKKLNS